MASVAPSTDQRVMSPLSSFSAPAPGAAESRNVSPPPNPEAAMEEALAARMLDPSRPRCHFGRGSGSSDRVRKNLVAARDIGGVKRESDAHDAGAAFCPSVLELVGHSCCLLGAIWPVNFVLSVLVLKNKRACTVSTIVNVFSSKRNYSERLVLKNSYSERLTAFCPKSSSLFAGCVLVTNEVLRRTEHSAGDGQFICDT